MFWLSRPPYVRWFAAAALVLAALGWDLSKRQTEPFPFASQPIASGTPITDDLIDWKPVAVNSLNTPILANASSIVDIAAGDPITTSVSASSPPLPDGWWSVPIDIPAGIPTGASIRVLFPDGNAATGIVTQPTMDDGFGVPVSGTVGFPQVIAEAVAQLASTGDLVVLVEP